MLLYIYVRMYIYMCICVYIYVYVYIYIYICTYICIYICVCICMHIYMYITYVYVYLDSGSGVAEEERAFIGVVDMCGFERVECNRLGQLLINFTDESMQISYNKALIFGEQSLYTEEGFNLGLISPTINNGSYSLIYKAPKSLLSILNAVCVEPHPMDEKFHIAIQNEHKQVLIF
jgi:hypothetical protein